MSRAVWHRAGLVAALVVATVLAPRIEGRYETTVPSLVENADFTQGWQGWSGSTRGVGVVGGARRALVVEANGSHRPNWVATRIPHEDTRFDHVRVTASVRAEDIQWQNPHWQGGQVRLIGLDRRGRPLTHWPATLMEAQGTSDWTAREAVLPVDPRARSLWLLVYVTASRGTLMLSSIDVDGVIETPAAIGLDALLALGWCAVWLLAGIALARRARASPARLALLGACLVVVVAGTTPQPHYQHALTALGAGVDTAWRGAAAALVALRAAPQAQPTEATTPPPAGPAQARRSTGATSTPADASTGGSRPAARETRSPRAPAPPRLAEVHDGTGHLVAFTVLALLAGIGYRHGPLVPRIVALLGFSASIQLAQVLSVGRDPDLADMWSDALGIGAGTLLALLALASIRALRPSTRSA